MPTLTLYNQSGSEVGDIEMADHVFGIEPHEHVMHEAVVMEQASKRQGTHATKNRSAVSGGGKKPWRQKGTGRARHGSTRSPIWVGGGTTFGPAPRSYSYKLPKKVRKLAMKSAVSSKVKDDEVVVLDQLDLEVPKTKEFVNILENLSIDHKALVVTDSYDEAVFLSARNIPGVSVVTSARLNVLDVLYHDKVVFTKAAAENVEEVLGS